MKTICVLGNFSGRNAGDAAILGGLLEDLSSRYPGLSFTVPTINTAFVRRAFARYRVAPVSLMPWNLSLKILGLPVFTSTLRSDLILVTDAIRPTTTSPPSPSRCPSPGAAASRSSSTT